MEPPTAIPDWRDPAAYAPLLAADRAILAWEWLRRIPAYRSATFVRESVRVEAGAVDWGLHRFENPDCGAPIARPMWTRKVYDAVLSADARPASRSCGFDPAALGHLLSIALDGGGERLLLCDGWRAIRLDLCMGSAGRGGVELRFLLPGPPWLSPPLLALRRFESLVRVGRLTRALHPPEPRARRQLLLLRTADALAAGAGQREIAACLLDPEANRVAWRDERPDLRLQAQRLVRDARAQLAGGYRSLLRPGQA